MQLEFRNDSQETIPAYGIFRGADLVVLEPGRVVMTGHSIVRWGCQYQGLVNGPVAVAAGGFGMCSRTGPLAALYETADGSPTAGERWGPRPGGWKLRKHTGGFLVLGVTNFTTGLVLVEPAPMLSFVGKVTTPHAKGTFVDVSIWSGPIGNETDTQLKMTAVYNRFGDIPANKWVRCVWNDQGNDWELVAAEC